MLVRMTLVYIEFRRWFLLHYFGLRKLVMCWKRGLNGLFCGTEGEMMWRQQGEDGAMVYS